MNPSIIKAIRRARIVACGAMILALAAVPVFAAVSAEIPFNPQARVTDSRHGWGVTRAASSGRIAVAVSAGDSVRLTRIDEDGRILDPFGIYLASARAAFANAAWNGENWIVYARVYPNPPNYSQPPHEITYVVSPDGAVVAGPVDQGANHYDGSVLAGNGRSVLMAGGERTYFVSPEGRIEPAPASFAGGALELDWTGSEYVLLSSIGRYGLTQLTVTAMDSSANVVATAELLVASNALADMAAGPDRLMIAWAVDDKPVFDAVRRRVWTLLVDSHGHILHPAELVDDSTVADRMTATHSPAPPTVAFDGHEFLVTWPLLRPYPEQPTWMARRYTAEGTPGGDAFPIGNTDRAAAAARVANGVALLNVAHPSNYTIDYRFCRSFAELPNTPSVALLKEATSQMGLSMAPTAGGALAAWCEADAGGGVMAASIDGTATIGTRLTLAPPFIPWISWSDLQMAAAPDSAVISWPKQAGTSLALRRVDASGRLLETSPMEVQSGVVAPAAIAWTGTNYLVAGGYNKIDIARLSASGQMLDSVPHTVLPAQDRVTIRQVRLTPTPTGMFMSWLAFPVPIQPEVWIARLTTDGEIVRSTKVWLQNAEERDGINYSIAANDRELLLVGDGLKGLCRRIWRVSFEPKTSVSGAEVLCNPPEPGSNTVPVWDGGAWWLVYSSTGQTGLRAVRIDDNLRASPPIEISDGDGAIAHAAVRFGDGLLIGYGRPVHELGDAYRLFYRYLGNETRRRTAHH